MQDIVVVSDCRSIVQRINLEEEDRSCCSAVIFDIRASMASFNKCSICFVSHLQNFVAHYLARSSEFYCKSMWRGVPPVSI
jgi:hypothetical protein